MERHEQNQAKLQNENKALADANTSLHSAVNRLIGVNNRQQTILDAFHRSLGKKSFDKRTFTSTRAVSGNHVL